MNQANDRPIGEGIRLLLAETASSAGQAYLDALARATATLLGLPRAIVGVHARDAPRVRVVSHWHHDQPEELFEYDLCGTPCEEVPQGQICQYPTAVCARFPLDRLLGDMGIPAYYGVPIVWNGQAVGLVAALDTRSRPPRSNAARRMPSQVIPGSLAGRRVLVVDDAPAVRVMARRCLEMAGAEVAEAVDGKSATSYLLANDRISMDVMLLDVTMPGMGGLETLAFLRERRCKVTVVMISGYTVEESPSAYKAPFLAKPFRGNQLLEVLCLALQLTPS